MLDCPQAALDINVYKLKKFLVPVKKERARKHIYQTKTFERKSNSKNKVASENFRKKWVKTLRHYAD